MKTIPQSEVLAWLQSSFPQLHAASEVKGYWVWLVVDLRGDHNKPIREAIKEFGFRFHAHGGHALPSGNIGTWAHSCEHPIRGRFRKKEKANHQKNEMSDDELLVALESVL